MARVVLVVLLGGALAACGTLPGSLPPGADETAVPLAAATEPETVPTTESCDQTASEPAELVPPFSPMPAPGVFPPGGTLEKIYNGGKGRLRAGVSRDTQTRGAWNPLEERFVGFDIDIVIQITMALFGVDEKEAYKHIEFHPVSYSERWDGLKDRNGDGRPDVVDIVVSTNAYTCARAKEVRLSAAYFEARKRFVSRRTPGRPGVGIDSLGDLAGKKVCVPATTTTEKVLGELKEKVPTMEIITDFNELSDCLVAFQKGEVDVLSANDASLVGVLIQDRATVMGKFSPEPPEYYTVASTLGDDELARFVNGVLEGLRLDAGTWFELCRRWDAPEMPCEEATPPPPAWRGGPPRER